MTASKAHILSRLKKDILLMQGFKPLGTIEENAALSIIRHAFPGAAFPLGAVHEFFCNGMEDAAASAGFVAGLVSSIMKTGAPSVWISPSKNIFRRR